ncbi:EsaB/YukD family protein [Gordonia sp. (in: high G+C Gram-positive bacteria)]|uniref:EsaB/YukD family protein n=1 Tax=Gordonia sp. (in: high G+C Gram-positive bacteria) TaxID=84139 RepID=UPI0039E2D930
MSSVFVRVTIVGPSKQVDVSLPAEEPVVTWLASLMILAGMSPESNTDIGTWQLSDSARGVLTRESTLASHGILDGETLYLTEAANAPEAPFVDDVLAAVEHAVDAEYEVWRDETRNRIVGCVLLAALAASVGLFALRSLSWFAVGAGVAIGVAALTGGWWARRRHGGQIAWAAVPAFAWAAGAAGHHAQSGAGWAAAVAGGALGVVLASTAGSLAGIVTRWTAGMVAGVMTVVALGATFGASEVGIAAWALAPLLLALGYTPTAALTSGGLVALVRSADDGTLAGRQNIHHEVQSSRFRVDSAIATLSFLIGLAMVTVALGGIWIQGCLAAYVSVVLVVQSRTYVHARHVTPVLCAAAAGAVAFLVAAPGWAHITTDAMIATSAALVIVVGGLALVIGLSRLDDVASARAARVLDTLAIPLTLGVVPLVFLAQGVYHYFWP